MGRIGRNKLVLSVVVLFCFVLLIFTMSIVEHKIYAKVFHDLACSTSIAEALCVVVVGISVLGLDVYITIKGIYDDFCDKGVDILSNIKSFVFFREAQA